MISEGTGYDESAAMTTMQPDGKSDCEGMWSLYCGDDRNYFVLFDEHGHLAWQALSDRYDINFQHPPRQSYVLNLEFVRGGTA